MESTKITIPKPCHEDWDKMTSEANGRHCASCNKVVIDFTAMSLEEIQHYFKAHETQKVCGHFKSDQVEAPVPYFHKKMMRLYAFIEKRVSVQFLKVVSLSTLTFFMALAGCKEQSTKGEPVPPPNSEQRFIKENKDSSETTQHAICDTTRVKKYDSTEIIMGKPVLKN